MTDWAAIVGAVGGVVGSIGGVGGAFMTIG